jgi:hypothetical protein
MDGKQSLNRAMTPTATSFSSARNLSSTLPSQAIKWQLPLREKVRKNRFGPPMNTDEHGYESRLFIGVYRCSSAAMSF